MTDQYRDDQLMGYVRERMSDDMPPDFVFGVMRTVQNTPQRRSWSGWPILAGGATVAAAVAAVVIGLSIVRPTIVGQDPSATPATRSAQPSVAASPSASASPSLQPTDTPEATPTAGEFGPVWSMSPEEAFTDPQSCVNPAAIQGAAPSGENVSYRISLPGDWFYNPAGSYAFGDIGIERAECSMFGREPFVPGLGPSGEAEINVSVVPEGDTTPNSNSGPGGIVTATQEYTVDGLPAVRYEMDPNPIAVPGEYVVLWIVGVAGQLPSEDSSLPSMTISASSEDPAELAELADVLDRMVATLDVLEP